MNLLEDDPAVEALLRAAPTRAQQPLAGRERLSEALFALALVAACGGLYALAGVGSFTWWLPAGLVLLLAVAKRIDFRTGAVTVPPTTLVIVPMLVLLPPWLAPLLVVAGSALGRADTYLSRRAHPDRVLLHFGDAASLVVPCLVLALAGHEEASLASWPIYLAALAAAFTADLVVGISREWAALGVAPSLQLRLFGLVVAVDVTLWPIGLLGGLAGAQHPAGVFLVGPLLGLIAVLGREREQRIEQALLLSDAYRGTALLMGDMLEADDAYTGGEHSRGVVALALAVGREMGLQGREQRKLEFGALLHDIGKLHTPDEIINKPGKLTPAEWEIVKRHPVDGQKMLDRIGGVLADVGLIVRHHHERMDGRGYPDGLVGEEIPLAARIICVCDAYSAMTTNRAYRAAMPVEDAIDELHTCTGTQFDGRVVDALVAVVSRETPARVSELLAA
jgi:putative nucleotidyltransferase with HDIG domain